MVRQWCCNPFNKKGHTRYTYTLRRVSLEMCRSFPFLTEKTFICNNCRVKLYKEKKEQPESAIAEPGPSGLSRMQTEPNNSDSSKSSHSSLIDPTEVVSSTNILMALEVSTATRQSQTKKFYAKLARVMKLALCSAQWNSFDRFLTCIP